MLTGRKGLAMTSAPTTRIERIGHWWLGKLAGYGYRPWHAVWYLSGVVLFGSLVFGLAHRAGLLAPTRRVMARVLVKRQRERFGGSSYCTDEYADTLTDGNDEVSYDFYIIFEVGARRLEFPVPMSVYADIDEGDTGLLVHKGNLFRSFIKGAGGWSDPVQAPIRKVDQ